MRTWFNRHFACVARVIQELRRADPPLPLTALVSHRHEHFAGYAVADEAFLEPSGLDANAYLSWVIDTVRTRRIECLVPGHEQALLTENAPVLAEQGCRVFASGPGHLLPRIHRKDLVYEDTAELVDLPRYAVCRSASEARSHVEAIEDGGRREVCLKPCVSVYGKGFSRITSLPQRATAWRPLVDHWSLQQAASAVFPPHIVMEFLPGHEYSVDIAARDGSTLAAVVRCKPLVAGGQLLADRPDLVEAAARLVRHFRINAIANVQFREDSTGLPRLLEINPRASGGIGMSCLAGINLPAVAFRAFLDRDWQPSPQRLALGRRVLEIPRAMVCPDAEPVSPSWSEPSSRGRPWRPDSLTIDLPTGELALTIDRNAEVPLGEVLGFGARSNPRRGFLLVNKLLGKHWPSRPDAMARVHRRLADKLVAAGLRSSGFVVIGMAETATGLGQGVFESLLDVLGPESGGVALQSSRYIPAAETCQSLEFWESHSHGPRLVLPVPANGPLLARCHASDTLVLCDDEISTGSTLENLVAVTRRALPSVRHVFVATIADLSGGACSHRLQSFDGVESAVVVSMISGHFEFARNPEFQNGPPAEAPPPARLSSSSGCSAWLGRGDRLELPSRILAECLRDALPGRAPILVVGTGEFMHPAYRLASALESRGLECRVQATTRSPLLVAGDIRSVTRVPDLTGGDIPHFLYNFSRGLYRDVILVHESADAGAVTALAATIGGRDGCVVVDLRTGDARRHAENGQACRPPLTSRSAVPGGVS